MPTARHCFILSIYNYSIVWPPLICQTPCWTLRTQIRKETIPVPKELTVLAMVMQYMMTTGCLRVQGNAEELSLLGGVKTVFTEKGAFALRQDEQRVWDISGNENGVRQNTQRCSSLQEKKFCGTEKVGDRIKEKDEAQVLSWKGPVFPLKWFEPTLWKIGSRTSFSGWCDSVHSPGIPW